MPTRKVGTKCYDAIVKYRQYILRASEQYLISITDLTENDGILLDQSDDPGQQKADAEPRPTEEHLMAMLEGFFKEASKYAAGLIGVERYLKVFKTARKLKLGGDGRIRRITSHYPSPHGSGRSRSSGRPQLSRSRSFVSKSPTPSRSPSPCSPHRGGSVKNLSPYPPAGSAFPRFQVERQPPAPPPRRPLHTVVERPLRQKAHKSGRPGTDRPLGTSPSPPARASTTTNPHWDGGELARRRASPPITVTELSDFVTSHASPVASLARLGQRSLLASGPPTEVTDRGGPSSQLLERRLSDIQHQLRGLEALVGELTRRGDPASPAGLLDCIFPRWKTEEAGLQGPLAPPGHSSPPHSRPGPPKGLAPHRFRTEVIRRPVPEASDASLAGTGRPQGEGSPDGAVAQAAGSSHGSQREQTAREARPEI